MHSLRPEQERLCVFMLHSKRFKQFDVLFGEYVLIQKPCRYFFSISKSIPLEFLVP